MSATAPQLYRVSTAARAVWAATEAVEALSEEDLRDAGLSSVAEALWQLADELEARIEGAGQG